MTMVANNNNDSLRQSVDFNRVLIDRKLAMRVAALHEKEEFNQRPAFEEKKRIYGALTFEPFKSTALRMNFESGRTRANRPLTILPANSISKQWLAAGRPGYDWSFYDDPACNPSAAAQVAGAAFLGPLNLTVPFSTNGVVVFSQPKSVHLDPFTRQRPLWVIVPLAAPRRLRRPQHQYYSRLR